MKNKKSKQKISNRVLKNVIPYYLKHKGLLVLVVLLSLTYSGLSVLRPILEGKLLGSFTNFNINTVIKLAGILAVVLVVINTIVHIWSETVLKLNAKINFALKKDMFDSMLNFKLKNYNTLNSGVFVTRLNSDCFDIAELFDCLTDRISEILMNVVFIIYSFIVNVYVGLFLIVNIILIYIVETVGIRKHDLAKKQFKENMENMQGTSNEMVRGIKDIKSLNLEKPIKMHINASQLGVVNSFKKQVHIRRSYNRIRDYIQFALDFLFILMCCFLITRNKLSIENFLIVIVYKKDIVSLIKVITTLREELSNGRVSAHRVFSIINYTDYEQESYGTEEINEIKGNVEFKNVSYYYNKKEKLFTDLSFYIPENKVVAFVGKSGEGKSTILDLINKNYEINSGDILIDGKSINSLSKDSIKDNITTVNQFPYLFNMSIKDNLKLVKPEASDEEIIEVCKKAGIHNYITNKENGYDTLIGENGVILSGGQKQRIAIARALLKNSKIILFDEATSALDNQTQNKIKKLTKDLSKDHTIIIVAHRLSTIINSDIIYVINDHKVVDYGKHEELIERCPEYNEIYLSDQQNNE